MDRGNGKLENERKDSIMKNKKLLELICKRLLSETSELKDNGLSEGRMGVILFLYNYAKLINLENIREIADDLIDNAWESIHQNNHSNYFYTGHSGIAWVLSELGRKGYLDMDDIVNSYVESIDFYILREQKTQIPVLIDMESGLFISGIYLLSRSGFSELNLIENYSWRENAIYLIEDCERILYKGTNCNNIFLPKLSLNLLNSILYYLINVHNRKIYPYKTRILIKYIYSLLIEILEQSNIQDIITSKCLLSIINEDIPFHDMSMIDWYIYQSWEQDENIWSILAESGLYTLLYNNKSIFEKVYSMALENNSGCINLLYNRLVEQEKISIKTALWIAHGLVAISEK